jgi:hypothetical protein
VADTVTDADGVTYLMEGPLQTPSGRKPRVRTVWPAETRRACPALYRRLPFARMIKELDCVALNVALHEHGLAAGDVGTVVHVYKDGHGFMVEFTTFDGRTVALTKVPTARFARSRRTKSITLARSSWSFTDCNCHPHAGLHDSPLIDEFRWQ